MNNEINKLKQNSIIDDFKVAQITDLHLEKDDSLRRFDLIIIDLISRGIEYVLFSGDYGDFEKFKKVLAKFDDKIIKYEFILGNHDDFNQYKTINNIGYSINKDGMYFFDLYNYDLFVFLDSSKDKIDDFQLEWFKTIVNKADYNRLVVFIHHPILDDDNSPFPLKNKKELENFLIGLDKEIHIFSGHYHKNYSKRVGNLTQNVCLSTKYQVEIIDDNFDFNYEDFGYRIIKFDKEISSEVILFRTIKE